MTIYKRSDGYGWRLDVAHRYPDGTSTRVRRTFDTKREAERCARRIGTELDDQWRIEQLGIDEAETPTLRAFEAEFMAYLENELRAGHIKRSTVEGYESSFRVHLLPFFGDDKLDEIGPRRIEAFRTSRSHLSPKTVKNHLSSLSKVFDVAAYFEVIDKKPVFKKPRKSSGGTDAQRFEYWDFKETKRVLAEVDTEPRIANLIRLALATGLRLGECCGLLWGDIDLTKKQLVVRRQIGRKRVTTPKSNRLRTVPLSDDAIDALERQKPDTFMRSYGGEVAEKDGTPKPEADWVFVDEFGVFSFNRIRDGLERIIKKAGVKRSTGFGTRSRRMP